jgi:hypothetical protein
LMVTNTLADIFSIDTKRGDMRRKTKR